MENNVKQIIRVEELFQFLFGVYLFSALSFEWWWFLVLILIPDIGMIGYLISSKIGAGTYNIFHHKGLAVFILFLGIYYNQDIVQLAGIILFAHSSLDRFFGYGLKCGTSFKEAHLGKIGKY